MTRTTDLPALSSKISIFSKNISLTFFRTNGYVVATPPRAEGRMRIVTTRAAGCDGRGCAAWRAAGARTAKACGPGALAAGAKSAEDDPQATVTQKPVSPGRARRSLLTPSRRECRCSGFICGSNLCAFYHRTQGCGCSQTPGIPCALSHFRGPPMQSLGHVMPRER